MNVRFLKNTLGVGEMAALRALDAFTAREVLTETTGRVRGRVWQHRGVFDAVDSYASAIRRMSAG